jgi:FkbM family methyltransferase
MSIPLLRRLRASLASRLHLPPPLVRVRLLDRELTVHEGSVRTPPDYDDAWILACALHAEVVFDVGCNIGQAAILMLQSPSIKHAVLIDANPRALVLAASNLIRNRLSARVHFVQAFVGGAEDAVVDFWTFATAQASSIYRSNFSRRSQRRCPKPTLVPTLTLDKICELYQTVPDLVKIDVEGAEAEVLLGSTRCVSAQTTRFLVEMHSNPTLRMSANAERVLKWCSEMGYKAWYLAEAVDLTSAEQIAHRGRCHLLLQPVDWEYPEWLRGIRQGAEPAAVSKALGLNERES